LSQTKIQPEFRKEIYFSAELLLAGSIGAVLRRVSWPCQANPDVGP
jgi:hypothetical protein